MKVLKDWKTKAGFRAVVGRTDLGHNCGYVGITKDHVLFGKTYSENIPELIKLHKKVLQGPIGKRGVLALFCGINRSAMDIVFNVHGSVTHSETSAEYPVKSDLHWIGFDCAHSGDTIKKCNLTFCIKECESLAKQIKGVKP